MNRRDERLQLARASLAYWQNRPGPDSEFVRQACRRLRRQIAELARPEEPKRTRYVQCRDNDLDVPLRTVDEMHSTLKDAEERLALYRESTKGPEMYYLSSRACVGWKGL